VIEVHPEGDGLVRNGRPCRPSPRAPCVRTVTPTIRDERPDQRSEMTAWRSTRSLRPTRRIRHGDQGGEPRQRTAAPRMLAVLSERALCIDRRRAVDGKHSRAELRSPSPPRPSLQEPRKSPVAGLTSRWTVPGRYLIWRVGCQVGIGNFSHLAFGVSGMWGSAGWVAVRVAVRDAGQPDIRGSGWPQDHCSWWGAAVYEIERDPGLGVAQR
jgi:hypothetical protein